MDSSEGWISSAFDLVRFLVHFDGGGVKTDLIKGSQFDIMVEPSEVDPNPYKFAKGLMITLALKSRTYIPPKLLPIYKSGEGEIFMELMTSKIADFTVCYFTTKTFKCPCWIAE